MRVLREFDWFYFIVSMILTRIAVDSFRAWQRRS